MRLTPSQIGMLQLLGEWVPPSPRQSISERIHAGHNLLVRVTGRDFGFDPQRWHEHLRETNAGGYRWSNKHLGIPKHIARVLGNPAWALAVEELIEREGIALPSSRVAAPWEEFEEVGAGDA